MSEATLDQERIELALQALHQIECLLPIAQQQVEAGSSPDAMLGLLGQMRDMNDAATVLIADARRMAIRNPG
ncbi:MAG: hypothetical protein K2Y02_02810 [Burkholderiaceae bacterium]|nr:hypothetical protein [Burkholderiaceae bacterium]